MSYAYLFEFYFHFVNSDRGKKKKQKSLFPISCGLDNRTRAHRQTDCVQLASIKYGKNDYIVRMVMFGQEKVHYSKALSYLGIIQELTELLIYCFDMCCDSFHLLL